MRLPRTLVWLACASPAIACQALLELPTTSGDGTGTASEGGTDGSRTDGRVEADGSILLPTPTPRAIVAVGGQHSCATTPAGNFFCWGLDQRNAFGQSTRTSTNPLGLTPSMQPAVAPIVGASAGVHYTCVVRGDGKVVCAGVNDSGQTGEAVTNGPSGPSIVPLTSDVRAVSVCAGEREGAEPIYFAHSCALLANGRIECWGANDHGQLGIAVDSDAHAPRQVRLPFDEPAQQIACGPARVCAVTQNNNVVCWGAEGDGVDVPFGIPTLPKTLKGTADQVAVGAALPVFTLSNEVVSRHDTYDANPVAEVLPPAVTLVRAAGKNLCVLTAGKELKCRGLPFVNWNATSGALWASKGRIEDFDIGPLHICATAGSEVICRGRNSTAEVTGDGRASVVDEEGVFTLPTR